MSRYNKQKGFTLIELLVVISIIGLLSSVVLTSLGSARVKARDARRLSDLRQIILALELYYSDNDAYPNRNLPLSTNSTAWGLLAADLQPYIDPLPVDPINIVGPPLWLRYGYDSDTADNNQTYGLMGTMESSSNTNLVQNDGGWWSGANHYYELGQQPAYCKSTYDTNWWEGEPSVCLGGGN